MTIKKIVVFEDHLVVFEEREIPLGTFEPSEDRAPMLKERGYTKVLPTFSGYGFAYHPEDGWVAVDLQDKNIDSGRTHQMPTKDTFRGFAVPEGEWTGAHRRIPVYIRHKPYRVGGV